MKTAALLLLAAQAWAGDGITWVDGFDKAKAESIRSGRPLLAYFTFDS